MAGPACDWLCLGSKFIILLLTSYLLCQHPVTFTSALTIASGKDVSTVYPQEIAPALEDHRSENTTVARPVPDNGTNITEAFRIGNKTQRTEIPSETVDNTVHNQTNFKGLESDPNIKDSTAKNQLQHKITGNNVDLRHNSQDVVSEDIKIESKSDTDQGLEKSGNRNNNSESNVEEYFDLRKSNLMENVSESKVDISSDALNAAKLSNAGNINRNLAMDHGAGETLELETSSLISTPLDLNKTGNSSDARDIVNPNSLVTSPETSAAHGDGGTEKRSSHQEDAARVPSEPYMSSELLKHTNRSSSPVKAENSSDHTRDRLSISENVNETRKTAVVNEFVDSSPGPSLLDLDDGYSEFGDAQKRKSNHTNNISETSKLEINDINQATLEVRSNISRTAHANASSIEDVSGPRNSDLNSKVEETLDNAGEFLTVPSATPGEKFGAQESFGVEDVTQTNGTQISESGRTELNSKKGLVKRQPSGIRDNRVYSATASKDYGPVADKISSAAASRDRGPVADNIYSAAASRDHAPRTKLEIDAFTEDGEHRYKLFERQNSENATMPGGYNSSLQSKRDDQMIDSTNQLPDTDSDKVSFKTSGISPNLKSADKQISINLNVSRREDTGETISDVQLEKKLGQDATDIIESNMASVTNTDWQFPTTTHAMLTSPLPMTKKVKTNVNYSASDGDIVHERPVSSETAIVSELYLNLGQLKNSPLNEQLKLEKSVPRVIGDDELAIAKIETDKSLLPPHVDKTNSNSESTSAGADPRRPHDSIDSDYPIPGGPSQESGVSNSSDEQHPNLNTRPPVSTVSSKSPVPVLHPQNLPYNPLFSRSRPLADRLHAVEQLTAGKDFEGKDSVIAKLDAIVNEVIKKANLSENMDLKLKKYQSITEPTSYPTGTSDQSLSTNNWLNENKTGDVTNEAESMYGMLDPGYYPADLGAAINYTKSLLDSITEELDSKMAQNVPRNSIAQLVDDSSDDTRVSESKQTTNIPTNEQSSKDSTHLDSTTHHPKSLHKNDDRNRDQLQYFPGYGIRNTSSLPVTGADQVKNSVTELSETPELFQIQDGRRDTVVEDRDASGQISGAPDTRDTRNTGESKGSDPDIARDTVAEMIDDSVVDVPDDTNADRTDDSEDLSSGHGSNNPNHKNDMKSTEPIVLKEGRSALNNVVGPDNLEKSTYPAIFSDQKNFMPTRKPLFPDDKKIFASAENFPTDQFTDIALGETSNGEEIGLGDEIERNQVDQQIFYEPRAMPLTHEYDEWQELLSHSIGSDPANMLGMKDLVSEGKNDDKMFFSKVSGPYMANDSPGQANTQSSPEFVSALEKGAIDPGFESYNNYLPYRGIDSNPSSIYDSPKFYKDYEPIDWDFHGRDADNFKTFSSLRKLPHETKESSNLSPQYPYPFLYSKLNALPELNAHNGYSEGEKTQADPLKFSNENELPRLIEADSLTKTKRLQTDWSRFDSQPQNKHSYRHAIKYGGQGGRIRSEYGESGSSRLTGQHKTERHNSQFPKEQRTSLDKDVSSSPDSKRTNVRLVVSTEEADSTELGSSTNQSTSPELQVKTKRQPMKVIKEETFVDSMDGDNSTSVSLSLIKTETPLGQDQTHEHVPIHEKQQIKVAPTQHSSPVNDSLMLILAPTLSYQRKESKSVQFSEPILNISLPEDHFDSTNISQKGHVTSPLVTNSKLSQTSSELVHNPEINNKIEDFSHLITSKAATSEEVELLNSLQRDGFAIDWDSSNTQDREITKPTEETKSHQKFLQAEDDSVVPTDSMGNSTQEDLSLRKEPEHGENSI